MENYKPSGTGESPLAGIPEFVNTKCPKCGGAAKRETDTMGGYACSSWYFFRFADPHNDREFADREKMDYWMPVDLYAGGIEHARSHLLYARFWTKVLYDAGYISFQEPFKILKNQGSLLAHTPGRKPKARKRAEDSEKILDWIVLKPEDLEGFPRDQIVWRWARMSKSKGNVVTPEEIAHKYGVDSLRIFEMFVAPFEDDVQWSEESINGSYRFLNRTWKWLDAALPYYKKDWREALPKEMTGREAQVRRKLHQTMNKVDGHIAGFQFNTAIAALMELLNEIYDYWQPVEQERKGPANEAILSEILENMVLMLAPFAPHMAEELWEAIGGKGTIYKAQWPSFDVNIAKDNEITLVIQVNGKVREKMVIPSGLSEDIVKAKALENSKIAEMVKGKEILKVLVIQGKLINIVIK